MQHTAVYLLQRGIQSFDTVIDLRQAVLHLGDLLIHGLRIHSLAAEFFLQFADLLTDSLQSSLFLLHGSADAFQIQAVCGKLCFQLRPGRLHFQISITVLQFLDGCFDLLCRQLRIVADLLKLLFEVLPKLFKGLGALLQIQQDLQVFLHFAALLIQLFQAGPKRLQNRQGGLQLGLAGLQLQDLILKLRLGGYQLRLLIVQLCFTLGRFVCQLFVAILQLLFCFFQLFLGILYILQLGVQLIGSVVHLLDDQLGNLLVERIDLVLIQNDMKLLLHRTGGGDSRHTGNALQLVHQCLVEEVRQLCGAHSLFGHRRHGDGQHGRIDLQNIRSAHHIIPAGLQGGDRLLDVHTDGVNVHRLLKFQHDHAVIFTGGGGDFHNMLQGGHGLLQRSGDLCLHFFRTGARIGGHDHHIGKVHIREQVRRHTQIRHYTQNQYGNHRNKNRHRFFHRKLDHTFLLTANTSAL